MDPAPYSRPETHLSIHLPNRQQQGMLKFAQAEERWHAVYTAPRHEKSVARQLELRGVDHFLPLYSTRRRWRDGSQVDLDLPLFPGYIFVQVSRATRIRVLECPGALYIVPGMGKQPAEISAEKMDVLRNGLTRDQSHPHSLLTVGQRVRIIRGALAGAEGILQRLKGRCRVVIAVEVIMQSVAVDADLTDLEIID